MNKLFVYGTLRDGKSPTAYIKGRLYLISWFPGVVPGDDKIRGEVHEVTDQQLLDFDRYEGIVGDPKRDLYRRERITAELKDGGTVECWVYLFNQDVGGFEYIEPIDGESEFLPEMV